MGKRSAELDAVASIFAEMSERGLAMRTAEDSSLDGRTVRLEGRPRINFGSCSYLGLELDPRVRAGAIEAVEKYGTQFSSSRSYLSAPPYRELESLLDHLFGGCAVITPNTTLAHLSGLPVLIHEEDAVVLDHQVHHSVRMGAELLRPHGIPIEVLPHNDVDRLEQRIRELGRVHRRVWYLADGVYSMHSDFAPMGALADLLDRYEHFCLYIDDAHGVGWCGAHGRGYALSALPHHPRMVVAVSFAKCFGAGGGALILPDEAIRRRINSIAGPMIFTGPIQPPTLGAVTASARILLSPEAEELQRRLADRVRFFNRLADEHGLLVIGSREAPIRFVGMGWPGVAADMVERLLEAGFWTNLASFPAVSPKRSGVRSTLTLHQEPRDIETLVQTMVKELPDVLARGGSSLDEVRRLFKLAPPAAAAPPPRPAVAPELYCQHETTIDALDAQEWDRLLGDRGTFSAAGLRLLEEVFQNNPEPENNWRFHYWIIRDSRHRPVLATFFTEALWKDDLLAPTKVSEHVETLREHDPYFLTSRVLAMGSLLTEGNHLHLDRSADWRGALTLLLSAVDAVADERDIHQLVIRDLPSDDPEIRAFLQDQGFLALPLANTMVLQVDWKSIDDHLATLKYSHRRTLRKEVLHLENAYALEVLHHRSRKPKDEEWRHLYQLYENVYERNRELNTFRLPPKLFTHMLDHREWELVTLRLEALQDDQHAPLPHGFLAGYAGRDHYVSLVGGLDYRLVKSHHLYRHVLWAAVRRAQAHGCRRLLLGMGAEQVKRSLGAKPRRRCLYVRSDDSFSADILSQIEADLKAAQSRMEPTKAA